MTNGCIVARFSFHQLNHILRRTFYKLFMHFLFIWEKTDKKQRSWKIKKMKCTNNMFVSNQYWHTTFHTHNERGCEQTMWTLHDPFPKSVVVRGNNSQRQNTQSWKSSYQIHNDVSFVSASNTESLNTEHAKLAHWTRLRQHTFHMNLPPVFYWSTIIYFFKLQVSWTVYKRMPPYLTPPPPPPSTERMKHYLKKHWLLLSFSTTLKIVPAKTIARTWDSATSTIHKVGLPLSNFTATPPLQPTNFYKTWKTADCTSPFQQQ